MSVRVQGCECVVQGCIECVSVCERVYRAVCEKIVMLCACESACERVCVRECVCESVCIVVCEYVRERKCVTVCV